MPHLILEYSQNVGKTENLDALFLSLQKTVSELGGIDIGNCKVRARRADVYRVAHGNARDAFVHLDIRFLSGRSTDVKKAIGERSLSVLRTWFDGSSAALALQITVEIRDIDRDAYFKHPEGTLSPG